MKQAFMWPAVTLGFVPAGQVVDILVDGFSGKGWHGMVFKEDGQIITHSTADWWKEFGRQLIQSPIEGRETGVLVGIAGAGQASAGPMFITKNAERAVEKELLLAAKLEGMSMMQL
jgi:hypothetical protein